VTGVEAEELIDALCEVPRGALLFKNPVGNLAIYDEGRYIGYVDLATATTHFIQSTQIQ